MAVKWFFIYMMLICPGMSAAEPTNAVLLEAEGWPAWTTYCHLC